MAENEHRKVHCNRCGHATNHHLLHEERDSGTERDEEGIAMYDWSETYELLRCAGCGNVTLRNLSYSSDSQTPTETLYPPSIARRRPAWWNDLMWASLIGATDTDTVYDLLNEVYIALQNDQLRLAAMGIRALFEAVMINKTGDKGGFAKNMDAFQHAGYISTRQAQILLTLLEAGSATIHRGWKPSKRDVDTLLDIIETVIATVFLHEENAQALAKKVPARPSRGKE